MGNLSSFPPLSRSSKHKVSTVHQHPGIYCTSHGNIKNDPQALMVIKILSEEGKIVKIQIINSIRHI